MGKNTGPRIIVAEIISMNIPTKRSRTFIAKRKTTGELIAASTASVILPGMSSRVRRRPKQTAPATMIRSVADVTAELTVIFFT